MDMKKIIIMLTALLFGVVLQAQEFDFSCTPDPITLTVNTDMGIGEAGEHSEVIVVTADNPFYNYDILIPDGYVASGEPYETWSVNTGSVSFWGPAEGSYRIRVFVVLTDEYNFNKSQYLISYDISDHIKSD